MKITTCKYVLYDSYAFTPALRDGDPFLFLRTGAEAPAYYQSASPRRLGVSSNALWCLDIFRRGTNVNWPNSRGQPRGGEIPRQSASELVWTPSNTLLKYLLRTCQRFNTRFSRTSPIQANEPKIKR